MCSVDGRILTKHWGNFRGRPAYEQVHNQFDSEAWMCGRNTMEIDFSSNKRPHLVEPNSEVLKVDYVANTNATSFAIAADWHGKLYWDEPEIDGDHIIEVLTECVSPAYLTYLQQSGISYIFAGKDTLDLALALDKLGNIFPIKTIMLEGGGHFNGAMLDAGLVDEISVLHVPVADGTHGAATVFDKGAHNLSRASQLKLIEVKQLDEDVIWTHYKVSS
jgi:riboflavin biosynthesis pyrimidine reductase